ncbi:S9 family peptidase [Lysobacter soli]|uniref:S9 family peptidase n=1 Tax=Lysobacter soli TaxID=453783 RepID=A0A3D8VG10_9GAMM|nr:prolyl oligopeptidase family serine peptidase [Lysobacter soli]RDY68313.1 S9 family peptidase [Lysobacter soli]
MRLATWRAFACLRGEVCAAGMAMLLCVFASMVPMDAAAMRRIDPGEDPKLAPDEGLVVLSVDANAPVSSIHVKRADGGTAEVLNYIGPGRDSRLYATRAGDYRWAQVNLTAWWYRSRFELDEAEFRFTVAPGKITYPGDLVLRLDSMTSARMHVANRSLPIIDWLEKDHGALYPRLSFGYAGQYPDPFPEFYRAARTGRVEPAEKLNEGHEPPKPGALALTAEVMWKPNRVADFALNGPGDLLAEAVRDDKGTWGLDLVDLKLGRSQRVLTTKNEFDSLRWKDARTLITSNGSAGTSYHVFDVGPSDGTTRPVRHRPINGSGRVVDLLPDEPGVILFEGFDSRGELVVHRIELEGDKAITSFQSAKSRDRLNRGATHDIAWYADGRGRLRAATLWRDETYVLVHGMDGVFHDVMEYRAEPVFTPVSLSWDGDMMYGYSEEGRAQRDLVAFDPTTRKITRTVFSKPGVDIAGAVFNDRREPVAARYYQSGRLVTEYFDDAGKQLDRTLQAAFPGRTVAVVDRSSDNRQLVLWVDGTDRSPQLYHLDVAAKRASLLEEVAPWLADRTFAPVHVLNVKAADGLAVDAFLTLPPGGGKRPLVVFPHGGPIGISDTLHFNRDVQFLASQGYAVLQVNFRGSDGYGKQFREAGHRNYGRAIEDDIDAALRAALASYPLDESRMCVLGASYGGYSALVSALRWPGRFRCAVSMSGVSDRVLRFTASDAGSSAEGRAQLEKIMGDPRKDMAEMQATSPLYHVKELTLPLMLVHGREDNRVDFEHTRRLVRMLNLEGRPPVVLAFPGMGHSFEDPMAQDIAWTGIAGFLQQYLGAPAAPATTAASASATPAAPGGG